MRIDSTKPFKEQAKELLDKTTPIHSVGRAIWLQEKVEKIIHGNKTYISIPIEAFFDCTDLSPKDVREIHNLYWCLRASDVQNVNPSKGYVWLEEDSKPAYAVSWRYWYICVFLREDIVYNMLDGKSLRTALKEATEQDQKEPNWQPPQEELEQEYTVKGIVEEIEEGMEDIKDLLILLKDKIFSPS